MFRAGLQLLNVHEINYMRQREMHTAELSLPDLCAEIVTIKLKSPVTDSILAGAKHHIFKIQKLTHPSFN
jgi:hypothetical protein